MLHSSNPLFRFYVFPFFLISRQSSAEFIHHAVGCPGGRAREPFAPYRAFRRLNLSSRRFDASRCFQLLPCGHVMENQRGGVNITGPAKSPEMDRMGMAIGNDALWI